ncbi:MAG: ECF transporter S component [Candidatus Thermoplasmatota archaeon]|nr:ECF transporter S component [Candidatus Thermoplasmatota archaeon]
MNTKQLAGTAMLSAIAAIMEILPVDLRFPLLPFRISFDPVGIPIAVAAILYGPTGGLVSTGIAGVALIAHGNPIGAVFKVPAELSTVLPLAMTLYALRRGFSKGPRFRWFIVGLSWTIAIVMRITVMTPVNYYFLQLLYSVPGSFALSTLPFLAVFNLIQGIINVVPAYLIVDRLPPDLKPGWLIHAGS